MRKSNTGWTMTVDSGDDTEPSTILKPLYGEWALYPDDVSLEIPDEADRARVAVQGQQTLEAP